MLNIDQKIDNFITNNIDLVSEYESIDGNLPLDFHRHELTRYIQVLSKINKGLDINIIIKEALKLSIKNNLDIIDSLEFMVAKNSMNDSETNITQQYFKEINNIYNKHKNNYDFEYCEENRDKLIEMNLKTVIMIAKKYQGLGLTLNELISAGNLGLVVAWDKFDPSRSKLKDDILNETKYISDKFEFNDLYNMIQKYLKYGDVRKKFFDRFQPGKVYTKKELNNWINSNIYNAKFNSVATMWIRAYILIEIDTNSRLVKKPKSEIYKDRDEYGSYKKENVVDIDAPISDDTNISISGIMKIEDETLPDIEIAESYNTLKHGLSVLLEGVKVRDRSIFLKKFGIGLPRPMTPKEIADQEGLSIARISQIFQTVIEKMQYNQAKYGVDSSVLFEAAKKIH